jgi:hypothetical protein
MSAALLDNALGRAPRLFRGDLAAFDEIPEGRLDDVQRDRARTDARKAAF